GDPVLAMLGSEADPEAAAALRKELGLDRPIHEQYIDWLGRVVRGDFGKSIRTNESVAKLIWQRLPATVELAVAALLVSIVIAIPAGIISAVRRRSGVDFGLNILTLLGISMPNFWIGLLLILVFAQTLRLLPPGGYVPLSESPIENLKYLLMPAVTL